MRNAHRGWRYKLWQKAVLQLGEYKCHLCSATTNLTVDHIKPIVTHPELAYDVKNGRILCDKCRIDDMLKSWQNHKFKTPKGKTKTKEEINENS